LLAGQTIQGSDVSLGERVGGFAMGLGQTVGGAAGIALSAPIAIFDPNSRRTYDEQVGIWAMSSMRPSNRRQVNSTSDHPRISVSAAASCQLRRAARA
jgi:hypothetical protein